MLEDGIDLKITAPETEELKQRERCKGCHIPSITLETPAEGWVMEDPHKRVGMRKSLKKVWKKTRPVRTP